MMAKGGQIALAITLVLLLVAGIVLAVLGSKGVLDPKINTPCARSLEKYASKCAPKGEKKLSLRGAAALCTSIHPLYSDLTGCLLKGVASGSCAQYNACTDGGGLSGCPSTVLRRAATCAGVPPAESMEDRPLQYGVAYFMKALPTKAGAIPLYMSGGRETGNMVLHSAQEGDSPAYGGTNQALMPAYSFMIQKSATTAGSGPVKNGDTVYLNNLGMGGRLVSGGLAPGGHRWPGVVQ